MQTINDAKKAFRNASTRIVIPEDVTAKPTTDFILTRPFAVQVFSCEHATTIRCSIDVHITLHSVGELLRLLVILEFGEDSPLPTVDDPFFSTLDFDVKFVSNANTKLIKPTVKATELAQIMGEMHVVDREPEPMHNYSMDERDIPALLHPRVNSQNEQKQVPTHAGETVRAPFDILQDEHTIAYTIDMPINVDEETVGEELSLLLVIRPQLHFQESGGESMDLSMLMYPNYSDPLWEARMHAYTIVVVEPVQVRMSKTSASGVTIFSATVCNTHTDMCVSLMDFKTYMVKSPTHSGVDTNLPGRVYELSSKDLSENFRIEVNSEKMPFCLEPGEESSFVVVVEPRYKPHGEKHVVPKGRVADFQSQMVLAWSMDCLQKTIISYYDINLGAPKSENFVVTFTLPERRVCVNEEFTVCVSITNTQAQAANITMAVTQPALRVWGNKELKDTEGLVIRRKKRVNPKSPRDTNIEENDEKNGAVVDALNNRIVDDATLLNEFDVLERQEAPLVCLSKKIALGVLEAKATTCTTLIFRALTTGVVQIPQVSIHNLVNNQYFLATRACEVFVDVHKSE